MAKKNRIYINDTTGTLLRKLRKKAKLTQAEMAERFGIAEWLYSKYEKDIMEFDVELIDYLMEHEENIKDLNEKILKILIAYVYTDATEKHLESLPENEREKAFEDYITHMAGYIEENRDKETQEP